jgi:hypothetical protein
MHCSLKSKEICKDVQLQCLQKPPHHAGINN